MFFPNVLGYQPGNVFAKLPSRFARLRANLRGRHVARARLDEHNRRPADKFRQSGGHRDAAPLKRRRKGQCSQETTGERSSTAIARRTAATKLVMFTEWGTFRMPAPTRPPNAGKGRPRGVPNKMGRTLKEMILGALDDLGGQQWLAAQAQANPNAFLTLLGRVLPHTLATEPGEPPIVLRFSEPDRRL